MTWLHKCNYCEPKEAINNSTREYNISHMYNKGLIVLYAKMIWRINKNINIRDKNGQSIWIGTTRRNTKETINSFTFRVFLLKFPWGPVIGIGLHFCGSHDHETIIAGTVLERSACAGIWPAWWPTCVSLSAFAQVMPSTKNTLWALCCSLREPRALPLSWMVGPVLPSLHSSHIYLWFICLLFLSSPGRGMPSCPEYLLSDCMISCNLHVTLSERYHYSHFNFHLLKSYLHIWIFISIFCFIFFDF